MSAAEKAAADYDDETLMKRLAAGNLSVLGTFYDRLGSNVRLFVLRATGDPSLVDDITHDAFLGLASAAKRYDPARSVRSLAIGIAGKLILRERRRVAITTRILNELTGWLRAADEQTPEDTLQTSEHLTRYERALARLTNAKRVALLMAFEGMSGAEIAAALEIPVATVWTRIHNARAELRRAVYEEGKSK